MTNGGWTMIYNRANILFTPDHMSVRLSLRVSAQASPCDAMWCMHMTELAMCRMQATRPRGPRAHTCSRPPPHTQPCTNMSNTHIAPCHAMQCTRTHACVQLKCQARVDFHSRGASDPLVIRPPARRSHAARFHSETVVKGYLASHLGHSISWFIPKGATEWKWQVQPKKLTTIDVKQSGFREMISKIPSQASQRFARTTHGLICANVPGIVLHTPRPDLNIEQTPASACRVTVALAHTSPVVIGPGALGGVPCVDHDTRCTRSGTDHQQKRQLRQRAAQLLQEHALLQRGYLLPPQTKRGLPAPVVGHLAVNLREQRPIPKRSVSRRHASVQSAGQRRHAMQCHVMPCDAMHAPSQR